MPENNLTLSNVLPAINASIVIGSKVCVGIDFGTSTTVASIAYIEKGQIKTKTIWFEQRYEDGGVVESEKLPTVIAWHNGIRKLLVGEGASSLKYDSHFKRGKNIWYEFKTELGRDMGKTYHETSFDRISNAKDATNVFFRFVIGQVKRYCENNGLGNDLYYAISIPASFQPNQRQDLIDVLRENGINLRNQQLIDEPNAAFLSYIASVESNKRQFSPDHNPKLMVFDFGGGTCDISIIEIGLSFDGLYTKNIAISKYTELGGKDIDRYLVCRYLMPRFVESNGHKVRDFNRNERNHITNQLLKIAERLKIMINEQLAFLTDDFVMPQVKGSSTSKNEISIPIEINTSKGLLSSSYFFLTNEELTDAMNVFVSHNTYSKRIKGEDDYNNIYMPIADALKKAGLATDELDYILFIGGSSKSPYIQESIREHFDEAYLLVPRDPQTHVSEGAAIHSLMLHAFNKCIIKPIISEPIIVVTKNHTQRVLLPAGTTIPCNDVSINDLTPSRDGQETIELPICISNENKILHIIKLTNPSGFPLNSKIEIKVRVSADKTVDILAQCDGHTCEVEKIQPFDNKELTTEERIALQAERHSNDVAAANGGIPTRQCLRDLVDAYIKANQNYKAAETLEILNDLYPSDRNLNEISVLFANAGDQAKALDYSRRAVETSPNNSIIHSNYAIDVFEQDIDEARTHLEIAIELDDNNAVAHIQLGRYFENAGDQDEAKKQYTRGFDILFNRFLDNTLSDNCFGWLISVARTLGHYDVAIQVQDARLKRVKTSFFNDDDLATSAVTTEITIL